MNLSIHHQALVALASTAIVTLSACSSESSDWRKAESRNELARYCQYASDYPDSQRIEEATTQISSLIDASMDESFRLMSTGEDDDAARILLEEVLSCQSENPLAKNNLAVIHAADGDFDLAESLLAEALTDVSDQNVGELIVLSSIEAKSGTGLSFATAFMRQDGDQADYQILDMSEEQYAFLLGDTVVGRYADWTVTGWYGQTPDTSLRLAIETNTNNLK